MLQYARVASIGTQIARLAETVPEPQRLVVLYDDFANDAGNVYRTVLAFLDLPEDGRTDFPRINPRKQLRWPWIQRLICHRRIPESLRRIGRKTGIHKVHRWLWRLNRMPSQLPPPSAELLSTFDTQFRDEICLTQELLRRDLSHWRRVWMKKRKETGYAAL